LSFPIPKAGSNPSIAANFTLNSSGGSACLAESSSSKSAGTLAPNASCELAISFEPKATGTLSGSLVLTDNNLNASAPGYASQSIALNGTATKVTPTISWAAPADIVYGTALSATQLDASSPVAGTFVYSPAAGTVPSGGSQTLSVSFTPTDSTDYTTATDKVTLTVNKATPGIKWATPAAIRYGTALSATQLDASSPVAGKFVYSPVSGTVLKAGMQTLSVTFTPTDTADYTTATASVSLEVFQLATLTSPKPGTVLPGPSATFEWSAGSGVADYDLWLGTAGPGSKNLFDSGHVTTTSAKVTGLPENGAKVYARLWSNAGGSWKSIDYAYTEAAAAAGDVPGQR
jgi:hypothetical protein